MNAMETLLYRGAEIRYHMGRQGSVVCVHFPEGNELTYHNLARFIQTYFEKKPSAIYKSGISLGPCDADGQIVAASSFGWQPEQFEMGQKSYLVTAFKRSIDDLWNSARET